MEQVDHRDHDGMTPLLVAAYEGHHEVCELLLESDADVDHGDNSGRTPLQAAASMGHAKVIILSSFITIGSIVICTPCPSVFLA